MKCTSLGSSPNVHGSLILATIPTNLSLMNSWLYIRYSRSYFSLTYLGLHRVLCTMFFGTLFDMSFMVTCITTKFVIICLSFYNIYIMFDFLPFFLYFVYLLLKWFHTIDVHLLTLGFFPIRSGWERLKEGALEGVGVSSSSKELNSLHSSIPKPMFSTASS